MSKTKVRVFDESIKLADNAMLKRRPELFYEWDFEKNDELGLDVYKVTYGSGRKAWWIGECGHEWDTSIEKRAIRNQGCPYCSNRRVLIGFNDMWTTNPELAKLLADPEDGHKYTQGSSERVDWRCLECGELATGKQIDVVGRRMGFQCPICSDGISFGEKFIYTLLKESKIYFEYDKTQKWSQNKRYDFYLPEQRWIIEAHGEQHYKRGGFESLGGKSFRDERENDAIKKDLAIKNNIQKYIVIDTRKTSYTCLHDSVMRSPIRSIIDDSCSTTIGRIASKSLVRIVSNMWDKGLQSSTEISKRTRLHRTTVARYLRMSAEIGWTDYCPDKERKRTLIKNEKSPVIQTSLDGVFIESWDSMRDAAKAVSGNYPGISNVCRGVGKSAYGYNWFYKEDYNRIIEEKSKVPSVVSGNKIGIVQLDKASLEFVAAWESASEIWNENRIDRSSISNVCRNKRQKTAGGYKWMYKKDYEQMLEEGLSHQEYMDKYYPKK